MVLECFQDAKRNLLLLGPVEEVEEVARIDDVDAVLQFVQMRCCGEDVCSEKVRFKSRAVKEELVAQVDELGL